MRIPLALVPLAFLAQRARAFGDESPMPDLKPDAELARRLGAIAEGFGGEVGIYARHLPSGRGAAIRADEVFPTASMIKVAILCGIFDRLERGELDWRAPLKYEATRKYPGEDLLASFKDGETVPLSKLATLMTSFSDNTASLWCQELAGGGAAINAWLASNGFAKTRVNSRTDGREEARAAFGWGQTSPREMAELVVRIREGRAVSAAASDAMYRLLGRTYWDGEALSQLPPTVHAATKQGAVNGSRSEVVLVNAPSGDYVFCAVTKSQKDQSWTEGNEGFVLLRRVSRALWEHFEPKAEWKPAAGASKYRP